MLTRVRRAEPDDWSRYRAIRLEALLTTPLAFASTYAREAAFADTVWRQRLETAAPLLAVDAAGEVVGTACGMAAVDDPGTVDLVAMYVRPAARGLGVGAELVRAVLDQGRAAGARRVRLHVVETNPAAERLYRRCGFARTGATTPLPHCPDLLEHEMSYEIPPPVQQRAAGGSGRFG